MMKLIVAFVVLCITTNVFATNIEELRQKEVCGSDGLAYENEEEFIAANEKRSEKVAIQSKGPCSCICRSSDDIRPVCATNGKTYVNHDSLLCHNNCYYGKIEKKLDGPCKPNDDFWNY